MKLFVLLFFFLSSTTTFSGTWERIDFKTLKFSGEIGAGDVEALESILKPDDKTLYVDSPGGDAEVGLQLALKLLLNQMTVIVDGLCASSCANYLFTAGFKKEIRKGWVGYHGNISAFLEQSWDEATKQLKEEYNLSHDQIEEMYQQLSKSAELEKEYLTLIGVDQSLFDRTQTHDKGMGTGIDYTFLVPRQETFEFYGIKNVTGKQDLTYGQELGLNNIYD